MSHMWALFVFHQSVPLFKRMFFCDFIDRFNVFYCKFVALREKFDNHNIQRDGRKYITQYIDITFQGVLP